MKLNMTCIKKFTKITTYKPKTLTLRFLGFKNLTPKKLIFPNPFSVRGSAPLKYFCRWLY